MSDTPPPDMPPPDEVLFRENGASWRWLLLGPIAALAMVFIQHRAGIGFQPAVPLFFLVLLSGVLYVQVKAARLHTSIELTADSLREGTEVLPLSEIGIRGRRLAASASLTVCPRGATELDSS